MMGLNYEFYASQAEERKWRNRMIANLPAQPGVYAIICPQMSEAYIGASTNVRQRVRDHLRLMAHPHYGARHPLRGHYVALGGDAFRIAMLEEVDAPGLLLEKEIDWRKKMAEDFCIVGDQVARNHGNWTDEEMINGQEAIPGPQD